jgi:gliding motility-associated-like protein
MKTRYLLAACLLGFLIAGQSLNAQNCLINAGNDTTISCGGCANLNATVTSINLPSSYTVANIPFAPFPGNVGTSVILCDDCWSSLIPLPFTFCYYGNTYNNCVIGSNGVLSFNAGNAGGWCTWPIGGALPGASPADMQNGILGPWHDLNPMSGASGTIRYNTVGTAPCRVFTVSWNAVGLYSCGNQCTHQTVIYEGTNIIENHITTKVLCAGWNQGKAVQGVQNVGATQAVIVPGRNSPTQWTTSNNAYRWTPNGAPMVPNITWWQGATQIGTGASVQVCPMSPTVYTAQVSYTGCAGGVISASDQVTVTASGPGFTVNFTNVVDVLCNGDANGEATANASVAGSYSYAWNTVPPQNTQTANNLPAGSYTVTVTDNNSTCTVTGNVTINQPAALGVAMSSSPAACFGSNTGSASVVANGGVGGYTYAWNTTPVQNTSTASNIPFGNYTVTVTDANGCTITGNVNVGQPPALNAVINPTSVSCFGGSDGTLTAVPNGGTMPYGYAWNTVPPQNTATATNLAAGTYTVTVTDANGCTFVGSGTVGTPALLQVSLNITPNSCAQVANGSIQAIPNGGTGPFSYVWSTTPAQMTQTATNLSGGTYTVTVTDANGCTATATGQIIPPTPITPFTSGPTEICFGEQATITGNASGGTLPYSYNWTSSPVGFTSTNATIQVSPTLGTNYYFQVTDANGCISVIMHPLDVHILPIPQWTPDVVKGCDSLTVTFTNSSITGDTYLWTFGDGSTSTATNPTHTFYNGYWNVTLTVTSPFGCVDSRTVSGQIQVIPAPIADFYILENPTTPIVLSKATFHFINTSQFATYYWWEFGDGNSSTVVNPVYTYETDDTFAIQLIAVNDFGCADTANYYPLEIVPDGELFVPNAFSPNGDNLNETFDIGGVSVTDFNIDLFDRWGKVIFSTKDMQSGWDGYINDYPAPEGVYAFKIKATFQDGHTYTKGGTVLLVR